MGTDEPKPHRDTKGRFAAGNSGGVSWKLTEEKLDRLVELVRAGNFQAVAARGAGLNPRTTRAHLAKGRADIEAGRRTRDAELHQRVVAAESANEIELIAAVKLAAVGGVEQRRVQRIAKPVLKDGEPQVVRDSNGDPVLLADGRVQYIEKVITNTEIVKNPADWRAGVALLQARHRSRFSPSHRLEVAGGVYHRYTLEMSPEDEAIATKIAARRMGDIGVDGRPPLGPDRMLTTGLDGEQAPGRKN